MSNTFKRLVASFKRFAFSTCELCHRGFAFNEVRVPPDGSGPLWFRPERGVTHSRCVLDEVNAHSVQRVAGLAAGIVADSRSPARLPTFIGGVCRVKEYGGHRRVVTDAELVDVLASALRRLDDAIGRAPLDERLADAAGTVDYAISTLQDRIGARSDLSPVAAVHVTIET